jgi:hypothetical protein
VHSLELMIACTEFLVEVELTRPEGIQAPETNDSQHETREEQNYLTSHVNILVVSLNILSSSQSSMKPCKASQTRSCDGNSCARKGPKEFSLRATKGSNTKNTWDSGAGAGHGRERMLRNCSRAEVR